ncbi:MAG: helix-turn-helix domain-containing protein [Gammaproteobacteria bacterium]|nr:helix-turn-helix domain-containing protein [Gammaproteobacteria bacterium]
MDQENKQHTPEPAFSSDQQAENRQMSDTIKRLVSITEAARINNVTRQAIYVAIKQNKLKATKHTTRWTIDLEDLEEYRRQKYSRTKSMYDGELLFDNKKGYYSVNQAAKMLGVPAQKIYYATRVGLLKAVRKGAAWVIHIDDIKGYKENYLDKQIQESSAM